MTYIAIERELIKAELAYTEQWEFVRTLGHTLSPESLEKAYAKQESLYKAMKKLAAKLA